MSTGGLSKTVKSTSRSPPILARASAHRLASWKQCLNEIRGTCLTMCLQSSMSEEAKMLEYSGLEIASIIDLASNSTSTATKPWLTHKIKPSLSAQSSARKPEVILSCEQNPLTIYLLHSELDLHPLPSLGY